MIYEWKLSLSLETVNATEDGVNILKLKTFIREDEIVFYDFWLFFMLDKLILVIKVIDGEYLVQFVKCLWSLKINGTTIQIVVEVAVEALLIILNDTETVTSWNHGAPLPLIFVEQVSGVVVFSECVFHFIYWFVLIIIVRNYDSLIKWNLITDKCIINISVNTLFEVAFYSRI